MKYYLCKIPQSNDMALNCGARYVKEQKSKWVALPDNMSDFISPGYNRGSDFIVHENVVYDIKKTFTFVEGSSCDCVIMGVESIQGCDKIV